MCSSPSPTIAQPWPASCPSCPRGGGPSGRPRLEAASRQHEEPGYVALLVADDAAFHLACLELHRDAHDGQVPGLAGRGLALPSYAPTVPTTMAQAAGRQPSAASLSIISSLSSGKTSS